MDSLTPHEITMLILALGVLLFSARVLGEVAKRCHLPPVLGEILAGILLGPTVLGSILPGLSQALFPAQGGGALALSGLTTLAIVLFLLVAGIEIDLRTVWRQGRLAVCVALAGMALPFGLGFGTAWFAPAFIGYQPGNDQFIFSLFMATAMSISALPIIVKILMDLNLYRSDLGVTIVAAAVLNDLLGWLVFAVILGLFETDHGSGLALGHMLWITIAFTLLMLTVVPWVIHRIIPRIQAYSRLPGGVLSFALCLALFAAAFTEWLGIHAIFGSFLAGVALGQSAHLRERTRTTIDQFISYFFAPLFFASIGLRVDFATHFDLLLTLTILALALIGKVIGSALGAKFGGLQWRESWGVGFGMGAQGTMGIILGVLALQFGIISQQVFVSLVVMALVTSLISGPMLQQILRLKKKRRFTDYTAAPGFLRRLQGTEAEQVISELAAVLAPLAGVAKETIATAAITRERIMATGIGQGVAVPHARLEALEEPLIAIGLTEDGIDFDAPDGIQTQIICLILTPVEDDGAQLEILADIAATFKSGEHRDKILHLSDYTEFLALVKSSRSD
jgi:Kef-type K+ transport system membrane component KefB/mannitol/fructose-specific phosphotransferase system IIA component (Ntr-type)